MSCNNIDGLNYIEFYSGVGGWTMAIRKALEEIRISCMDQPRDNDNTALRITPTCVADYDHSELCNEVYNFNFKTGKSNSNTNAPLSLSKGNEMLPKNKKRRKDSEEKKSNAIERLSIKNLEDLDAFIWMMSPPCQPHTRQHNNQHEDVTDPRSKSFLHLCHLISQIKEEKLPSLILLENVIGFEYVRM
jgi:tRNA (cytosine38-C5)-methyltransferase